MFTVNLYSASEQNRKFACEAGTHQWRLFKSIEKEGVFSINRGDHVVVLVIRMDKVIIEDPNHSIYSSKIEGIKKHLIPVDHFPVPYITYEQYIEKCSRKNGNKTSSLNFLTTFKRVVIESYSTGSRMVWSERDLIRRRRH